MSFSFQGIIDWLQGVFGAIGRMFSHIWQWLMKHIIRHIIAVLTAAYEILDNIVQIFAGILRKIRDWYFRHVFPIQKAILEVIARLRVALSLLRLLGVKWAAKLDADLQKIQSWVTTSIQDVTTTLNTLSSYADLIIDPRMVLRGDFFAASMFSSLGALKRAVAYGGNAPLSATDAQAEQDDTGLLNPGTPIIMQDSSGNLTYSPGFDTIRTNMGAALPDYVPSR